MARAAHGRGALEVGDSAGGAQGAGPAARREAAAFRRLDQQGRAGRVGGGDPLQDPPSSRALSALSPASARPSWTARASAIRAAASAGGGRARSASVTGGISTCRSMRSGSGPEIRLMDWIWQRVAAAFARVGRGDQLHPRPIALMGVGAGHRNLAGVGQLAQGVQRLASKFAALTPRAIGRS